MVTDSRTLLSRYARTGSETAFRELVSRYIDFVYSTAHRLVDGDAEAAKDVAQTVFVDLANQARTLPEDVMLGGWLHLHTRFAAGKLMRTERRRRSRERQAAQMNALEDHSQGNLAQIAPVLDEAIGQLDAEDRDAILLRFFERQDFRSVGDALSTSEEAARKRVARALEKLRIGLSRRGVTLSAAALGTTLATEAVTAAPAGLASAIAATSLSVAGSGAGMVYVVLHAARVNWRLLCVPGIALMIALTVAIYRGPPPQARPQELAAATPAPAEPAAPQPASEEAPVAAPAPAQTSAPRVDPIRFELIDAETGAPIAGAKLQVGYTSEVGKGKTVRLATDGQGRASIEFPQKPYSAAGLFVTADGHVPKLARWTSDGLAREYVMRLETGSTVSGVVVDEFQQPVPGVRLRLVGLGINFAQKENIEFGSDTDLRTDSEGRWSCNMIPREYETMQVLMEHPQFAPTTTEMSVNNEQAKNVVLRIERGITVAGVVTDTAGRPVTGASIREIHDRQERGRSATTDSGGRFEIKNVRAGETLLAVHASGLGPALLGTNLSMSPTELSFVLPPGHVLKGHVVDQQGAPVTNALVRTFWAGHEVPVAEWSARTDSEGRFEWDSAPGDPLQYSFHAEGFILPPACRLNADGSDHAIKLARTNAPPGVIEITGSVTDEQTGLPLDGFRVLLREIRFPPRNEFSYKTDGKSGKFRFSLSAPWRFEAYQVQVQSEGYVPVATTNLLPTDGDQSLRLKMSKGSGPAGIVVLPTGEPATNATVFRYEIDGSVWRTKPGELRGDVRVAQVQADSAGRFSFRPELLERGLIAIGEQGYADIPLSAFGGTIVLQPWGRVEGTLTVDGRAGANETICIGNTLYTYGYNGRRSPPLVLELETRTDAEGNFAFEKVPPGEYRISQRLAKPAGHEDRVYDRHGRPVTVLAGAAAHVAMGGTGRRVIGKLLLPPARGIEWQQVVLKFQLKLPSPPSFSTSRTNYATMEAYVQASKAAYEARRLFQVSERGRELERAERSYDGFCRHDGSFSLPDIPPAAYELIVQVHRTSLTPAGPMSDLPAVLLSKEIVVTEAAADRENEAFDLGWLEVAATSDQAQK